MYGGGGRCILLLHSKHQHILCPATMVVTCQSLPKGPQKGHSQSMDQQMDILDIYNPCA